VFPFGLAEFFAIVLDKRDKELLIEILHSFITSFDVMDSKRLSDCVVDKRKILQDKSIPRGLLAFQAAGNEGFFLFGHGCKMKRGPGPGSVRVPYCSFAWQAVP
jgi:hypothetical protein